MNRIQALKAASLLISVPLLTALAPMSALAASPPVPFLATFAGTAAFGSDGLPAFSGSGQARYMGAITTSGHVQFISPEGPICPGGVPNTNTETLTAANGDSLTIVSDDVACPTGPNQYQGSGHWSVVAGTGRFTAVQGSGQLSGHSDFGAGTFDLTLTGSITQPLP